MTIKTEKRKFTYFCVTFPEHRKFIDSGSECIIISAPGKQSFTSRSFQSTIDDDVNTDLNSHLV